MAIKTIPEYEVFAIKYARRESTRNQNFLFSDPHEGPMPIDYYVWAIVNNERSIVVDIGFDAVEAQARGRQHLRCPAEALVQIGVPPKDVKDVILTHLHYDHCGNLDLFPQARFFLQDREMTFATGRNMLYDILRHAYTVSHVQALIGAVYDKRVVFVDQSTEVAPGVTVHHVGGHTDGLQIVASGPAGAGSCSPPTPLTFTPTWTFPTLIRFSTASATCCEVLKPSAL